MLVEGLTFPHLSDADPEIGGEGTLDPLGLEEIADRLANQIAPGITARMTRVRFLTAIGVASVVVQPLEDTIGADGKSTPWLAFEWLTVEALARNTELPPAATRRVPGIEKARAAVNRGTHLDARSYLKVPKVFGFHGVYKRLAVALDIVDDALTLQARGVQLVRAWEREQGLPGFTDREPDSPGGDFCNRLEASVRNALQAGAVQDPPKAGIWRQLSNCLRPDGAGVEEKRLTREWLLDPSQPLRREVIAALDRLPVMDGEAELLQDVRKAASTELRSRLDAIRAYEVFSGLLLRALRLAQYLSTAQGTKPLSPTGFAALPATREIVSKLDKQSRRASEALEPLGLAAAFEDQLGGFRTVSSGEQLFELLAEHHDRVQKAKKPAGKRSWFDIVPGGTIVRFPYRMDQFPEDDGEFVHPFRVRAIQSFLEDLR